MANDFLKMVARAEDKAYRCDCGATCINHGNGITTCPECDACDWCGALNCTCRLEGL